MASRSSRMYKDSPTMERDDESGKMAVKKPSKDLPSPKEAEADLGDGEPMHEGAAPRREMMNRHVAERMQMHSRHETDHEHGKADKAKHVEEMETMGKRHMSEFRKMMKGKGEAGMPAAAKKDEAE